MLLRAHQSKTKNSRSNSCNSPSANHSRAAAGAPAAATFRHRFRRPRCCPSEKEEALQGRPDPRPRALLPWEEKSVTTISGLDLFGVKLPEASKLVGKKFACGASVTKTAEAGKEQVEVQGDVVARAAELLVEQYGKEGEGVAGFPLLTRTAVFLVVSKKRSGFSRTLDVVDVEFFFWLKKINVIFTVPFKVSIVVLFPKGEAGAKAAAEEGGGEAAAAAAAVVASAVAVVAEPCFDDAARLVFFAALVPPPPPPPLPYGRQNCIIIPAELISVTAGKIALDEQKMASFIDVFRGYGFRYFESPHLMYRGDADDWGDPELKVYLTKRRYGTAEGKERCGDDRAT